MRQQSVHAPLSLLLAAVVLFATMTGCAPSNWKDHESFIRKPRPIVGDKPYVIEPPDGVRVSAPAAPEIDNVNAVVRPDGYITLPLLGDVFAAGKTPQQLGAEIEEAMLKYYEDLSVKVQVVGFNSKFFYLAGEISQGPRAYTGNNNVMDAVLSAGVSRTSWPKYLVVLRPNEEGELIRRMTINFNDIIRRGDLKYNAVLEEGDIIYMPINPLAMVGVFVQQLLQPVQPAIQLISTPGRVAATSVPGLP